MPHMQRDSKLVTCIQICLECQSVCQDTLYERCLEMGGKHVDQMHVKLMADCIEACQTAANGMKRGSPLYASFCAVCADVCDACAKSCERVGDTEMQACADLCRRCADACREMSKLKRAA